MPPDDGVLIDYVVPQVIYFTMDGVLFPVDLIFVHSTDMVSGLLENVPVGDKRTLTAGDQSRWLMVTNAGWAAEHGIVNETPVRFENLPR